MSNTLILPIRINALFLAKDTACVGSRADFTVLPYTNGEHDHHADTPFLAEAAQSNPFSYRSFPLKAGMHLHWELPKVFTSSMARPMLEYKAAFALGKSQEDINQLQTASWIRPLNSRFASIIISPASIKQALNSPMAAPLLAAVSGIEHLLLNRNDHFPAFPDRWLVTRYQNGSLDEQWVVESDYLYPVGEGNPTLAVSYLLNDPGDDNPPFRFMGRKLSLTEWAAQNQDDAFLNSHFLNNRDKEESLNSDGYGELTFAAFYPNCFSILGFHDDTTSVLANPTDYSYEVSGFFQDDNLDPTQIIPTDYSSRNPEASAVQKLYQFCKDFKAFPELPVPGFPREFSADEIALMRTGGWLGEEDHLLLPAITPSATLETTLIGLTSIRDKIETLVEANYAIPTQTICHGRIGISAGQSTTLSPVAAPEIALGNTGIEALSAYLGKQVSQNHALEIEEHLESLQFFSRMDHLHTDIQARLREFRHEKQFSPESGGMRWMLRLSPADNNEISGTGTPEQPTLPDEFAHLLNQLNIRQKDADHLKRAINAQRKQLYSDWNKYQASRYVPNASIDAYPNVNLGRFFIEQAGLEALNQLLAQRPSMMDQLQTAITAVEEEAGKLQLVEAADIPDVDQVWAGVVRSEQAVFIDTFMQLDQQAIGSGGIHGDRNWQAFTPAQTGLLVQLSALKVFRNEVATLTVFEGEGTAGRELIRQEFRARGSGWFDVKLNTPIPVQAGQQFTMQLTSFSWISAGRSANYAGGISSRGAEIDFNFKMFLLPPEIESTALIYGLNKAIVQKTLLESHSFPADQTPEEAQQIIDQRDAYNSTAIGPDDHYFNHSPAYFRLNRLWLESWLPALGRCSLYELKRHPDHRFWKPKDPVVLFAGADMQSSPDYAANPASWHTRGYMPVQFKEVSDWKSIGMTAFPDEIHSVYDAAAGPVSVAYDTQRYPMMLDWQVAYFPSQGRLPGGTNDGYEPNYLSSNYELKENAVELTPEHAASMEEDGHSYIGSTLLSAYTGRAMRTNLETLLLHRLEAMDLTDFYTHASIAVAEQTSEHILSDHLHAFIGWFFPTKFPRHGAESFGANWHESKDQLDTFLDWTFANVDRPEGNEEQEAEFHLGLAAILYDLLSETDYLSQSLGGFTRALLMETKGLQLSLHDPLGFPADQALAQRVAAAVGTTRHHSVLSRNAFHPIRAGAMDIVRLRMIDSFGVEVVKLEDIEEQHVAASEMLAPSAPFAGEYHALLPPRLTQPARLNFRWRSALDDDIELNDHPATSPICGWVLVNELERSFFIYDQRGAALGSVDTAGNWRVFPGHSGPVDPAGIEHPHLRRMVRWMTEVATVSQLVDQFNAALDTIEPDTYAQHNSLALLMSRPLALVRASLQLETHGHVALHHGWNEFRKNLNELAEGQSVKRDTHGVENLKLEIRLGEDGQLNDGLVGFFIDGDSAYGYRDDRLHSPPHPGNQFTIEDIDLDLVTGRGKEIRLSILMDPRAKLHATTGITPVQRLEIPVDQYRDALKGIEVAFLTAPLLTPDTYLHLSLPEEPGFAWSWLERRRDHWSERSTDGILRRTELIATFGPSGEVYWTQLLALGWLQRVGEERARILPQDQRPDAEADIALPPAEVSAFLANHLIGAFQQNNTFEGKSQLREGWLKLTPANDTSA